MTDELQAALPDLPSQAGVVAMPGMTAPKLMWLRKHEPEIFARIKTVLLPKDYIRFCLTGEKVTEMSDAAGTLWLGILTPLPQPAWILPNYPALPKEAIPPAICAVNWPRAGT